jgi:tetratricopeptide (TPR) repeat protein
MDKEELRERYEATGNELFYEQARPLYEQALADSPHDPRLLLEYGYLRECHGRFALRDAVSCYERAIAADPLQDKPHWQLIGARASLHDQSEMTGRYEHEVAAAPGDPRNYRFLASAYLLAGERDKAAATIAAGLQLAPDDASLTEQQGDLYAAANRPDDALASWRRAFDMAPDGYGISMRFSAAFLLERLGRLGEAANEWRFIIGWMTEHGDDIHLDWPKQMLDRLDSQLAAS